MIFRAIISNDCPKDDSEDVEEDVSVNINVTDLTEFIQADGESNIFVEENDGSQYMIRKKYLTDIMMVEE